MKALTAIAAAVASLSLIAAHAAMAQLVPSEKALVAQTVDGTRMTVEYSRPRMRGRTTLLGTVEPWGRAWTPGADDASTLDVGLRVRVLGSRVRAGLLCGACCAGFSFLWPPVSRARRLRHRRAAIHRGAP